MLAIVARASTGSSRAESRRSRTVPVSFAPRETWGASITQMEIYSGTLSHPLLFSGASITV